MIPSVKSSEERSIPYQCSAWLRTVVYDSLPLTPHSPRKGLISDKITTFGRQARHWLSTVPPERAKQSMSEKPSRTLRFTQASARVVPIFCDLIV
jgi:hypothetical protein